MDLEFYPLTARENRLLFEFESISEQKRISKRVTFAALPDSPSVFNLALMDLDQYGATTDVAVSNNSDMPKVMATVIQCVFLFLEKYPSATVHITGNSPARTRLYRATISREISKAKNFIEIYGMDGWQIEPFRSGKHYDAFLIRRL